MYKMLRRGTVNLKFPSMLEPSTSINAVSKSLQFGSSGGSGEGGSDGTSLRQPGAQELH